MTDINAIEAVAEAWASIDGKLDEFKGGKCGFDEKGHFDGYMSEASELISRIGRRGFKVVAANPTTLEP